MWVALQHYTSGVKYLDTFLCAVLVRYLWPMRVIVLLFTVGCTVATFNINNNNSKTLSNYEE
jgi:hypothetical protein